MIEAPLPDEPAQVVPVAFKVGHEIRSDESIPKLADLVRRLHGAVNFDGRKVLYAWVGGTRRDWRGKGFFRALSEQQEAWAYENGFHEIVVKTKNRFYEMRGTLDNLQFEVVKFEPHPTDNGESKVYLSRKLDASVLKSHKLARTVVRV
jgi:GNAT superfamily N-acetyltransferase